MGTGVAIVWYTVETFFLRRETVRQNEIAVSPFIVANVEHRQISSWPAPIIGPQLVMKNIGKGLALFVQVEDMTLTDPAGDRVKFSVRFTKLSHLEERQECAVPIAECAAKSKEVDPAHLSPAMSLDPKSAVDTYTMRINYQDVRGHRHTTRVQMGKAGIALLP